MCIAKKTLSEETIRWFLSQIGMVMMKYVFLLYHVLVVSALSAAAVEVMHKHNVIVI